MGSISYSNSFSNVTYTDFVLRTVDNTQKLVIGTGASQDSNACIYIVDNKLGFYKPPELGYVLDCINGLRVDDFSNVYIPTSLHVQNANISNLEIPDDGSFIAKKAFIQNVIGLNDEVHIGNIGSICNIYIGGSNTTFQNIHIGGSSNGSMLNIGVSANDIINLNGDSLNLNTQNVNFKNKTIIVNYQNDNNSGSLCGLQISESNNISGYIVTSSNRTSWLFKTPLGSEWNVNLANSNVAFNGNRIVLSSNNNIGIGTSTPDTLLTVAGDVKVNNNMTVQNVLQTNNLNVANNATFSQLNVNALSGTSSTISSLQPNSIVFPNGLNLNGEIIFNKLAENDHQISGIGYSNNQFKFQLDNVNNSFVFSTAQNANTSQELMRIRGNGNLGIGTSNPIEKLDVNGSISVNNLVYSSFLRPNRTSNLFIDSGTLNGWTFINSVNSNGGVGLLGKHVITSNVIGFGTSTPQYLLDVNGTGNFVNTRCCMSNSVFYINPLLDIYEKSTLIGEHIFYNERFNRFVAMTDGFNAGFGAIVPMMGNVRFYTGNYPGETTNKEIPANSFSNLERMVIGENVGVGTSNPVSKLTVAGTTGDISIRNISQSNFTQSFELQDDTGNIWSITRPSNTAILKIGNNSVDHLFFIENGNVGVGSAFSSKSTEALLHVYDNSNMNDVLSVGNSLGSFRFTNNGKLAAYNFNGIKYFEATNNLSDKRLKTNITPLDNSLEKLIKLNGVSFKYNEDLGLGSNIHLGCIAQDVEKHIPEVVEKDETTNYYRIHYEKLVPVLIESIKELHQEIKMLKEKLDN